MFARIIAVVFLAGICAGAFSQEDCKIEPAAVSKEMYDLLAGNNSLGITVADVDPANLSIKSLTLRECFSKVKSTIDGGDELTIALLSCLKRHPPANKCETQE